jgi:hypothetical protein
VFTGHGKCSGRDLNPPDVKTYTGIERMDLILRKTCAKDKQNTYERRVAKWNFWNCSGPVYARLRKVGHLLLRATQRSRGSLLPSLQGCVHARPSRRRWGTENARSQKEGQRSLLRQGLPQSRETAQRALSVVRISRFRNASRGLRHAACRHLAVPTLPSESSPTTFRVEHFSPADTHEESFR